MVPNLRRGRRFGKAVTYVLTDKVDKRKARVGARVIGTTSVLSLETAGLEMSAVAALSDACRRPMLHYTVSLDNGERLSDADWNYVVNELNAVVGVDDTHQDVRVVHDVTSHLSIAMATAQHIHVILNVISPATGRTPSDHWDSQLRRRMQARCRELERELGLRQLRLKVPVADKRRRPSRGQLARQARTGIENLVDAMGDKITAALERPSLDAIASALAGLGCRLEAVHHGGHLRGLRVVDALDPKRREAAGRFGGNTMPMIEKHTGQSVAAWLEQRSQQEPLATPTTTDRRVALKRAFDAEQMARRRARAQWQDAGREMGTRHTAERDALVAENRQDQPEVAQAGVAQAMTGMTAIERRLLRQLLQAYQRVRAAQRRERLAARQRAEWNAHQEQRPRRQLPWTEWLAEQVRRGTDLAVEAQHELARLGKRLATRGLPDAVPSINSARGRAAPEPVRNQSASVEVAVSQTGPAKSVNQALRARRRQQGRD